jgi:hypothetical protein
MTAVTDSFNRANGGLGVNWTALSFTGATGAAINSDVLVGANTTTSGNYWAANSFGNNQYSQITVATPPSSGWVGVTVRMTGTGEGYLAIYFSGSFYIYNESGTTTPTQLATVSGSLSAGDILCLAVTGTTLTLYQNGTSILTTTDSTYTSGAPGVMFFNDTSTVSLWAGGDGTAPPALVANYSSTDGAGAQTWNITSLLNGGSTPVPTRVLPPSSPSATHPHAFLWMLPVEIGQNTTFGDPLATVEALSAQNSYNLTCVQPGYPINPWYANNPGNTQISQETFLMDMVSWVTANFAVTGSEKHYLIGFSKSGLGGSGILFRHPAVFAAGAFWDFPAGMDDYTGDDPDYSGSPIGGGSSAVYGTNANFTTNYELSSGNLSAWASGQNYGVTKRIWIGGYNTFPTDVADYDPILTTAGIEHYYASVSASIHNWAPTPGWVGPALAAIIPAATAGALMAVFP